VTAQSD